MFDASTKMVVAYVVYMVHSAIPLSSKYEDQCTLLELRILFHKCLSHARRFILGHKIIGQRKEPT